MRIEAARVCRRGGMEDRFQPSRFCVRLLNAALVYSCERKHVRPLTSNLDLIEVLRLAISVTPSNSDTVSWASCNREKILRVAPVWPQAIK